MQVVSTLYSGATLEMSSLSSGECGKFSSGPTDEQSRCGYFSRKRPHSRPAWMA